MSEPPAASPHDEDVAPRWRGCGTTSSPPSSTRWAGLELVSVEVGEVEVALPLKPHHLNPGGILHGGLIATLADTAIGLAVRSALPATART